MINLTAINGTSLSVSDSPEGVDIPPLMGANGITYYIGEYSGIKAWALENSLLIESLINGELVADKDSAVAMLPIQKAQAVKSVEAFAENMRSKFTGNAAKGKLGGYQINSDILNLLDSGVAFNDLDPLLKQKVEIEVSADDRYTTVDQLIALWRTKRGTLSIISAWIGAIENNTITAINSATNKDEIDAVMAKAKAIAEAKATELTI